MILFDASFLASFYYILPMLLGYSAAAILWPQSGAFIYVYLLTDIVYRLLQVFVYSFFKYSIMDFIKSLFQKTEFSFKRLGQFYLLNTMAILPFFFAFNFILGGIKEAYRPYFFLLAGTPVFLFLYIILNLAHSFFYEGNSLKNSFGKSFSAALDRVKSYRETILAFIAALLLLSALFFAAGYFVRFFTSGNNLLYLETYDYFKKATIILSSLAIYFVVAINRISFYNIAREAK